MESFLLANSSPPSLPPPSPVADTNTDQVTAETIFAVLSLGIGTVLLLVGRRYFRLFLGLTCFVLVTGIIGYPLIDANQLPWWASCLIAAGIGTAAGLAAAYAQLVGLVVCSFVAGAVVTALPVRVFLLDGAPRMAAIVTGGAAGLALSAFLLFYKFRVEDDDAVPLTNERNRTKARKRFWREVIKVVVTSVLGAYGIVHGINQWWHDDGDDHTLQAYVLLRPSGRLDECGTPCIALEIIGGVALVAGLCVQFVMLYRQASRRGADLSGLQEPMAPGSADASLTDGQLRATPGAGRPSELAQRMRFKYCGGRAATVPVTHTATSVATAEARAAPATSWASTWAGGTRTSALVSGTAAPASAAARTPHAAPTAYTAPTASAAPTSDPWYSFGGGAATGSRAAPASGAAPEPPVPGSSDGGEWPQPAQSRKPVWPPADA